MQKSLLFSFAPFLSSEKLFFNFYDIIESFGRLCFTVCELLGAFCVFAFAGLNDLRLCIEFEEATELKFAKLLKFALGSEFLANLNCCKAAALPSNLKNSIRLISFSKFSLKLFQLTDSFFKNVG